VTPLLLTQINRISVGILTDWQQRQLKVISASSFNTESQFMLTESLEEGVVPFCHAVAPHLQLKL
jgi:hypothetical protein